LHPASGAPIRPAIGGRFYTVVDLVNRLESEARASRQGRLAEYLTRMDFIILDELGYLPFAQTGGQLLFHLPNGYSVQREIVDRAVLSLKDAGVPSFLIE
jgi:DNA replication protein DnaC